MNYLFCSMIKNILIIYFILSHVSANLLYSQQDSTYKKTQFKNQLGQVTSEGYLLNGKPEGYWISYFKNGKIKMEGNRKNFVIDSTWKFYLESGKIQKAVSFYLGKKHGFTIVYDTINQKIISKTSYSNDVKSGNTYIYYPSGKLQFIYPYLNDQLNGLGYELNQDSTLIAAYCYKNGLIDKIETMNAIDAQGLKQGLQKEFYTNGQIKLEATYKDGKLNGYVKQYDKNGSIVSIEKFLNNKKIEKPKELAKLDVYKTYYDDGLLQYEGGYNKGIPVGIHFHYKKKLMCDSFPVARDDTSLVMIKKWICRSRSVPDSAFVYEDGEKVELGATDENRNRIGTWFEYYTQNLLKGKGAFKNNKKVGLWKYYHYNQTLEQEGEYDEEGLLQNTWKWYREDGTLIREENYINNQLNGNYVEYNKSGQTICKGNYLDDLEEGEWVYETLFFKEVGQYKGGQPIKTWNRYFMPSQKLRYTGKYINGEPHGTHIWYYPNGKILMKGDYINGTKYNDWVYYNEEGELYLTITFFNDIEIKYQGIYITPTYEESLRTYDNLPNTTAADQTSISP